MRGERKPGQSLQSSSQPSPYIGIGVVFSVIIMVIMFHSIAEVKSTLAHVHKQATHIQTSARAHTDTDAHTHTH